MRRKGPEFVQWRLGDVAGNEETKMREKRDGNKEINSIKYT
jgi:hypothetical protein